MAAAAGSFAPSTERIQATPRAPASMQRAALSGPTPPSAKTGRRVARQASASLSTPCAVLPGVSKTGAKTTKSASDRAVSPAECTLSPTICKPSARASAALKPRAGRWTPSAPAASATSARSLTRRGAANFVQISRKARARTSSSRAGSGCRSCTPAEPCGSTESAARTASDGSPSAGVIKYRRINFRSRRRPDSTRSHRACAESARRGRQAGRPRWRGRSRAPSRSDPSRR